MSAQEIVKSNGFRVAAIVVGAILIALVSFGAGIAVGIHKAKFSFKFGENYERNFVGYPSQGPTGREMMGGFGPRDMMRGFDRRGFRNAHGIAGTIISVADNKIIIKDRDGQENTISVGDKTLIKRGQDTISAGDLKNDEQIVVMGRPGDNGTVNADLIRVFDSGQ